MSGNGDEAGAKDRTTRGGGEVNRRDTQPRVSRSQLLWLNVNGRPGRRLKRKARGGHAVRSV